MSRKYVQLVPVTEVELCPECDSDYTRFVESELVNGSGRNRCLHCKHEWESDFRSGEAVKYLHPRMFDASKNDDGEDLVQ